MKRQKSEAETTRQFWKVNNSDARLQETTHRLNPSILDTRGNIHYGKINLFLEWEFVERIEKISLLPIYDNYICTECEKSRPTTCP